MSKVPAMMSNTHEPNANRTSGPDFAGPRALGQIANNIATAASKITRGPVPTSTRLAVMGLSSWNDVIEDGKINLSDIKEIPGVSNFLSSAPDAEAIINSIISWQHEKINNTMASAKRNVAAELDPDFGRVSEHAVGEEDHELSRLLGELQDAVISKEDDVRSFNARSSGSGTLSSIELKMNSLRKLYSERASNLIDFVKSKQNLIDKTKEINDRIISHQESGGNEVAEKSLSRMQLALKSRHALIRDKFVTSIDPNAVWDEGNAAYKPLKLPVLHMGGNKKSFIVEVEDWIKKSGTLSKYYTLAAEVLRTIKVFDVASGSWAIPMQSKDLDLEVQNVFEAAGETLYKEIIRECAAQGRSDCLALAKQPSMVVGLKRVRIDKVKDSGVHLIFRLMQALEEDSASLRRSFIERFRNLHTLFTCAADIEPGTAAAIEIIEKAEEVGVTPTWDECGDFVKLALEQCDTAIRLALMEASIASSAADPLDCTAELRCMFSVALASRTKENAIKLMLQEQRGVKTDSSAVPLSSFSAGLSSDGNTSKRLNEATKLFKKLQSKSDVLMDCQLQGYAAEIAKCVDPKANESNVMLHAKRVMVQLKSGEKLQLKTGDRREDGADKAGGKRPKCWQGDKCKRKNCTFSHPRDSKENKQKSTKACWQGDDCKRKDCRFSHPRDQKDGSKKGHIKNQDGICKAKDCQKKNGGDKKSYCEEHFKKLRSGESFERKDGHMASSSKKRNALQANLVTVVDEDGTEVSATMDEQAIAVMKATLGGAKFKKAKKDEKSALESLMGAVGYAEQ